MCYNDRMIPVRTKENTCFFTGHRDLSEAEERAVRLQLVSLIGELAERGYSWFVCGGALGFDTAAALMVLVRKLSIPDIGLYLALPCREQARKWAPYNQRVYDHILEEADGFEYVFETYNARCMMARNRRMADMSSLCIAYQLRNSGGTAATTRFASSIGVPVYNLAEHI
ncbi:MAG: SLOG family protein [Clostridia bacterium]|nr:SLOG family protein [Clostridia bacterium]